MEKKSIISLLFILTFFLSVSLISASSLNITLERQFRLTFGHIVYLSNMKISPETVSPGEKAEISFVIENAGTQFIRDIIVELNLPAEVYPYNDITVNKIPEMLPEEKKEIKFKIITAPDASEGIYKIPVVIKYVNHVGDERTENETISLVILGKSKVFAELKSSEIYKGNNIGNVKINLINNNVGNIKFLLAELKETEDFEILSSKTDYIGDLDSDDFSEVSFKIKVLSSNDEIILPLLLTYKDSLNNDYSQEINIPFKIRTAKELGVKKSNSWIVILVVIILVIAYMVYRNYKRKKLLKEKHASFKTKFNF